MSQKKKNFFNKLNPLIWQLICFAVSIAFFSLILLNRSPNILRPISISLRTGFGIVIPIAAIIVYASFRAPGRLGDLLSTVSTLSLFAFSLAGLWASGLTQTTVWAGIIPMYDAEYYYIDALRLINGTEFSLFSARRSLFPGLLAVLLSLTNQNLMLSLAILTWITGFACYLAVREIQRTHGTEVAVFSLLILFLFYRAHSGVSMSEHLGVALGAIGFGSLWHGASRKNIYYIGYGLLVSTLALNARAGAFFMLPILIVWAGIKFRSQKWISWRAVFVCTAATAIGFLLNLTLTKMIATPSGVPFANFSYTLYGLSSGGKSWAYIFEAHPEVLQLEESEQPIRIYQLAFEKMRLNPLLTLQGALFNWKMLFSNSYYNVYSYIGGESNAVNIISRWGMYFLCIVGVYAWMRNRGNPINSLIMASIFGVFISVPFLPPTDAYRMRPYAASIIVLAALPALGLHWILEKVKVTSIEEYHLDSNARTSLVFSILLISATILGPILVLWNATSVNIKPIACAAKDAQAAIVRFNEGSYINIKRQNLSFLDWMPNFHIGLFKQSSHGLADAVIVDWAENLEPSSTIFKSLNHINQKNIFVVMSTDSIPTAGTYVQLCGRIDDTHPSLSDIFYADEVIPLSP